MRRSVRGTAATAVAVAFASAALAGWAASDAMAATSTEDLADGLTATDLAQELAGAGVAVSNVRYTGTEESAGRFAAAEGSTYGFEDGVALSTGWVDDLMGPNSSSATSRTLATTGDTDLTRLAGYETRDASVLEFDFVPASDTVFISYVFASEEYSEYANTGFNDVFAFFVNGTNCAVTDDEAPVSVNTINGGSPENGSDPVRPDLFRDNADASLDTQADGLTVVLVCNAAVRAGETNRMKLAIADGSDEDYDSWVLLAAEGITTEAPAAATPGALMVVAGVVAVGGVAAGATAISHNTPARQQERLLRKHVRLAPREDLTGRHTSTPARPLPSLRLEPRAGRWEHVSEEDLP
jgi:hypothetical protein